VEQRAEVVVAKRLVHRPFNWIQVNMEIISITGTRKIRESTESTVNTVNKDVPVNREIMEVLVGMEAAAIRQVEVLVSVRTTAALTRRQHARMKKSRKSIRASLRAQTKMIRTASIAA
jgi:hypothetical protein